jgi:hypothetical protein
VRMGSMHWGKLTTQYVEPDGAKSLTRLGVSSPLRARLAGGFASGPGLRVNCWNTSSYFMRLQPEDQFGGFLSFRFSGQMKSCQYRHSGNEDVRRLHLEGTKEKWYEGAKCTGSLTVYLTAHLSLYNGKPLQSRNYGIPNKLITHGPDLSTTTASMNEKAFRYLRCSTSSLESTTCQTIFQLIHCEFEVNPCVHV